LTKQLNRLLDRHIRNTWAPKTKTIIQSKQNEVKKQLQDLGLPTPTSDVRGFFQSELTGFCTAFNQKLENRQQHFFISTANEMILRNSKAKASQKKNYQYDVCNEVLTFVDTYMEGLLGECFKDCKLLRFPVLTEQIIQLYRTHTIEPKKRCMECLLQIIDLDATPLPPAAEQFCVVSEPGKRNCPICKEDGDPADSGGWATLHCTATARHYLHVKCLLDVVRKGKPQCSLCRTPIPSRLEKPARSGEQIDPVMMFTLKTIWKFLVGEVKSRFSLILENHQTTEEDASMTLREAPNIASLREKFAKQLEVLRGALLEISKYTQ